MYIKLMMKIKSGLLKLANDIRETIDSGEISILNALDVCCL